MAFKKTGRKLYTFDECIYCDKVNCVCKHEKMNKISVTAGSLALCGGKYFVPLDDYEHN